MNPLAYHLIWTTYGTWLPGDARGWIESGVSGVQPASPQREDAARKLMAESEIRLSSDQRELATQTIHEHSRLRGWLLHAVNVRSNHIHVVVTCACSGKQARDQFKQWTSRRLSDHAGLTVPVARGAGRRHWWTEGGDALPIGDEIYLANAIEYVTNLQGD